MKTAFLNESLEEDVYMDQLEGFSIREWNTWPTNLRSQYIDLNKLLEIGSFSLMIPLHPLDLRTTLLIGVFL